MRNSTSMIYSLQLNNVMKAQSCWLKAGEQLSSGKRVVKPSDDPVAASQAVGLSQSQAQSRQFSQARISATARLSLEESTLSDVTNLIHDVKTLIVHAGNGTLSDNDRGALATQLEGIHLHLLNLANTIDGNGRYIFAGYKSDTPPFDSSRNTVEYVGGMQKIMQKVDASRTMVVGHTGSDVFMSVTSHAVAEPDGSASEKSLFTLLGAAITSLRTTLADADDDTRQAAADVIGKTNRGLRNVLNNVLTIRAESGTQLSELEKLNSLGADRDLIFSTQLSELTEADSAKTYSDYMMKQTALQAAFRTCSDMFSLSLFKINGL